MPWKERRNGHRYFYRSLRINGRVVSEYVGNGPAAQAAEAEIAERRATHAADQAERAKVDAIAGDLVTCERITKAAVAAALEAAGYHQHRRQWRKRRG